MDTHADRIRKTILLKAPRDRVWRAISDSGEFGTWFGVELDGKFVPGGRLTGTIAPTKVDPDVAGLQEPHAGKTFELSVDRIEPMRLFSFRWHPFAVDEAVDYSTEPETLVVFKLDVVRGGTMLTIAESGFDQLPSGRREKALEANDGGWEHQTKLIEKYLEMRSGPPRRKKERLEGSRGRRAEEISSGFGNDTGPRD